MGQAAYTKKVRVHSVSLGARNGRDYSNLNGTWHEVPTSSPSLDFSTTVLDDTELSNNVGYRRRLLGLSDWNISCDSMWNASNMALLTLRESLLQRKSIAIQYLPNLSSEGIPNPIPSKPGDPNSYVFAGVAGWSVVENFNMSGEVDGLEETPINVQADGKLVDIYFHDLEDTKNPEELIALLTDNSR